MSRLYEIDHQFFREVDSEEKAYLLGFIAADGCINGTSVTVTLQAADQGHLEKIKRLVGFTGPIRAGFGTIKDKHYPRATVNLSSKAMVADLLIQGVTPRKSLTLQPWNGPAELMRHWWRGLFDGNGSWSRYSYKKRYWRAALTGSGPIVSAFDDYALALTGKRNPIYARGRAFQSAICGNSRVYPFAVELYRDATIWLDRKKALADEILALNSTQWEPAGPTFDDADLSPDDVPF